MNVLVLALLLGLGAQPETQPASQPVTTLTAAQDNCDRAIKLANQEWRQHTAQTLRAMLTAKQEYIYGLKRLRIIAEGKKATAATLAEIAQIDSQLSATQEEVSLLRSELAQVGTMSLVPDSKFEAIRKKLELGPKRPGNAVYMGRFGLYNQYGKATIFINGNKVFEMGNQTAVWSPILRLREGDVVAVKVGPEETSIRLAFVEKTARMAIQPKASDFKDLTDYDVAKLTAAKVAEEATTAKLAPTPHGNNVLAWKKMVVDIPLDKADWCVGKVSAGFQLGFVVSADLVQMIERK